ncbi:hypothetical protein ZOSMA_87G00050 [Zostera marina]|uniref:DUF538 family protein n=1 Tax=Zostera marina TaxID=29655 RepID=A0A0K9NKW9_ZOSMR|nr:hypothetical protein ZOSMA_87G00050 [Zostera marina]
MAAPSNKTLLVFLLLLTISSSSTARITNSTAYSRGLQLLTAYDWLQRFNFPIGILPLGVTGYLLKDTGSFEVYWGNMKDACTFLVNEGEYELKYKQEITGTIKTEVIEDLKGVSVKFLFLWIRITDVVVVDGEDTIRFYVGPFYKSFPRDNFADCPRCGFGSLNLDF